MVKKLFYFLGFGLEMNLHLLKIDINITLNDNKYEDKLNWDIMNQENM